MVNGTENTLPNACVAIQLLTAVIEQSTAATLMGLEKELAEAAQAIRASNPTSISLAAGCELFIRYVTRTQALEFADLKTAKQWLIQRGKQFGETSLKAREQLEAFRVSLQLCVELHEPLHYLRTPRCMKPPDVIRRCCRRGRRLQSLGNFS